MLISAASRSLAAHVAIGIDDQLLHAYEPGIILEPRDDYMTKSKQYLVAEYAILPDVSDGLDSAIRTIGKGGFFGGMAQIAIIRALRLTGSPLQRLIPSNERTCARFVMTLDRDGSRIPEWRDVDKRAVAPGDLLMAAKTGPSFMQVA